MQTGVELQNQIHMDKQYRFLESVVLKSDHADAPVLAVITSGEPMTFQRVWALRAKRMQQVANFIQLRMVDKECAIAFRMSVLNQQPNVCPRFQEEKYSEEIHKFQADIDHLTDLLAQANTLVMYYKNEVTLYQHKQ